MRLILLFPLLILCCPKNGWIYEESCFVPSQLQKKLFDLINFDQEVDELDKDSMVTKYCSKVCVEMLVRNPDLLMTKILWMIDWVNNIKINAMTASVIESFNLNLKPGIPRPKSWNARTKRSGPVPVWRSLDH